MAHLELSKAPVQALTPQEQKRVIAMVDRMGQQRQQPAWMVWTVLYRFAATHIWQRKPQKEDDDGTRKTDDTRRRRKSITGPTGRV
jgi:hypothetical protein